MKNNELVCRLYLRLEITKTSFFESDNNRNKNNHVHHITIIQ